MVKKTSVKKAPVKKKRGRKKKSELLLIHETEQQQIIKRLDGIDLYSSAGLAANDFLRIGIALDLSMDALKDMFETFAPDIFRSMRID